MPTALITGASKGIGKATAELFARSGWDLLLTARDQLALKVLSDELVTFGNKVHYKSIDLTASESIQESFKGLIDLGAIPSVLINNAGSAWTGELLSMPLAEWEWILKMNLTSVFQICSSVVPLMRNRGGIVINISSHAANNAFPDWGAYCVSKAALASFTKCLAEEERPNSIRACTLTLGAVDTPLWDSDKVDSNFDRRSMLSVDKVASTILQLAQQPSDQAIENLTLMPARGAF